MKNPLPAATLTPPMFLLNTYCTALKLELTTTPVRSGSTVLPVVPLCVVEPVNAVESASLVSACVLVMTAPAATEPIVYWFRSADPVDVESLV